MAERSQAVQIALRTGKPIIFIDNINVETSAQRIINFISEQLVKPEMEVYGESGPLYYIQRR
ncbi:MAG: hypothetical protein M1514_02750 [Patescibacteria group bacterium]|nr:hypothetical protein [Patescibacteria group bacterium]